MAEHDLKIWPEFFEDLSSGKKTFQLRKNDRAFSIGDVLRLREWDPKTGIYSGRQLLRKVEYMLEHRPEAGCAATYGILPGYAILALASQERK